MSKASFAKNIFKGPLRSKGDLMCKNGCGFYGNPEWQWYCSKCWREQGDLSSKRARKTLRLPKREATLSFSGTEKNLKDIFKKKTPTRPTKPKESPSRAPKPPQPSSSSPSADLPPEARGYQSELSSFLATKLDKQEIHDVFRQLKVFMDKVSSDGEHMDIEELSNYAQEFYQSLWKRLSANDMFQGLSDEDQEKVLNLSERFVMVVCFKQLFCPITTCDEEKDLELQNRIRQLNWISTKELSCVINESSQQVRDYLHKSINYILEMDGKISPEEKLDTLVSCCKSVFEMLKSSNESPASADEFLPCLIYVILKANPPRLHSNVNFITRFRNEEKLRMGEAGYFFANLCVAMSFIENMSADSVNMDKKEFESYVNGEALPPGSWQSSLLMCESLQAMTQNLKLLTEIKNRYNNVSVEAEKLSQEMQKFRNEIRQEVQDVLERTSYTIKGPKKPVTVDEDLVPPPKELPAPLTPMTFSTASKPSSDDPQTENVKPLETQLEEADDNGDSNSHISYRGFSAQNINIPSISCNVSPQKGKDKS